MAFHSDYHDYLFKCSEIAALLETAGFPLPDLAQNTGDQPTPQWMRLYAARSALRTYEAAFILAGKEPPNHYPKTHYMGDVERRNLNAIEDSVLIGDLGTKNTQWHIDDEPQTWQIDQQSFIEWSKRSGMKWPLESMMPKIGGEDGSATEKSELPPTSDASEIATLRQEVADLRATVDELKKSVPLHPGHLMGKAIEAQQKYWQDPEKRPKAEVIVRDLRSQYPELSEARAKAIEAVACPIER